MPVKYEKTKANGKPSERKMSKDGFLIDSRNPHIKRFSPASPGSPDHGLFVTPPSRRHAGRMPAVRGTMVSDHGEAEN
jgi:hypothetical protein